MPGNEPFTVETRVISLAVTHRENAVVRIDLDRHGERPPTSSHECTVAAQLVEYFEGERREFTFPIRLRGTPFEMTVWQALRGIPYGDTMTYGELAQAIGILNGARAVGGANGRNPLPVVVPCHRVVAADGALGGYGGGLDLKRRLLELEGHGPLTLVSHRRR